MSYLDNSSHLYLICKTKSKPDDPEIFVSLMYDRSGFIHINTRLKPEEVVLEQARRHIKDIPIKYLDCSFLELCMLSSMPDVMRHALPESQSVRLRRSI